MSIISAFWPFQLICCLLYQSASFKVVHPVHCELARCTACFVYRMLLYLYSDINRILTLTGRSADDSIHSFPTSQSHAAENSILSLLQPRRVFQRRLQKHDASNSLLHSSLVWFTFRWLWFTSWMTIVYITKKNMLLAAWRIHTTCFVSYMCCAASLLLPFIKSDSSWDS